MALTLAVRDGDAADVDTPLLGVLLQAGTELPSDLSALDDRIGGALSRSLRRGDFKGARDESLHLDGGASKAGRVLLIGVGSPTEVGASYRRGASLLARQAHRLGVGAVAVVAPGTETDTIESIAVGLTLGCWEYLDLKTPPPEAERKKPLTRATVVGDGSKDAKDALGRGEAIAAGYEVARLLAQMPGNLCTPDHLAKTASDIGRRHKLKVTVLGRREMERQKMGSFLCVAQGTPEDPKLVTMEYRKGKRGDAPIVLVGKGLCFDTGGISIKPADRMEFMKFDMCGAAGVLGAMEAIARLKLKVNVVGIFGATTNMPSGTAVKPGDVVISHLGKSIEIINTDAEGRLVLADLLSYARRFKPAAVIDAATLTGAVVIALGHIATGVLGTDQALVDEVLAAARQAAEPGWQLPLWDDYKELIKSDVADIKNSGGRAGGTISAAMFLKEFAGEYPWVHLDIAGTAYSEADLVAIPRGPTGVPTGTFVEFVRGRAG
ncbi:MAG TPA: leucyl aminopeptidase [Gemmatimonadaceae bacterium]|nr:leucyl aminopeptidase [Gemmatimonadaceae bacterium]